MPPNEEVSPMRTTTATAPRTHRAAKATGLSRLGSHDGSTLLRAHPTHRTLSLERQASIDTRIPVASKPAYAVESAGYQIREHKIRSRLYSAHDDSDGSGDEERPHTTQTHSKFVMYRFTLTHRDGKTTTIYRRYHDFEELHEMLPGSVQHTVRLPGRRYWTRLTNSRFTCKAITTRQAEMQAYLERLLSIVPDYDAVQMFICDDWLARDSPTRRRQFMRVKWQQRRLQQLIRERLALEASTTSYADTTTSTATEQDTTAQAKQQRGQRPYTPSRLGPNHPQKVKEPRAPKAPAATSDADSERGPVIVRTDAHQYGFVATHPRVHWVKEELLAAPATMVSVSDDPQECRRNPGTPARRKWLQFPRAPLAPDN